jgi:hypothetical protein
MDHVDTPLPGCCFVVIQPNGETVVRSSVCDQERHRGQPGAQSQGDTETLEL